MTGVQTENVIAPAIALASESGIAPKTVKLLPYGTFSCRDGRGPFILEGPTQAQAVIDATRRFHGDTDMLFNYDHQSEYAARDGVGGRAVASGWIKTESLRPGPDGIYADVSWTPAASAAIAAREYRYVSPFFTASKADRRVIRLVNAALTNSPALELPALASREHGLDLVDQLTAEELSLCAIMRVSLDDFAATKAAMQAKRAEEVLASQMFERPRRGQITEAEADILAKVGVSREAYLRTRDAGTQ